MKYYATLRFWRLVLEISTPPPSLFGLCFLFGAVRLAQAAWWRNGRIGILKPRREKIEKRWGEAPQERDQSVSQLDKRFS